VTLSAPIYIACIGSRETPSDILAWMTAMGGQFVRSGYRIITGNAPGADQAWAAGGNKIDPAKVTLCLPWASFENRAVHFQNTIRVLADKMTDVERHRYYDVAAAVHPAWEHMTPGGQRLHARNAMIVQEARLVFGYCTASSGGTLSAFRIAREMQIPCYDVSERSVRAKVDELIDKAVRR
jgi:hypothetical protein